MYYEERLIDGILHWRGTPDGEWQIVPAEKLGERVIAAEAFRAAVAPALAALRAELVADAHATWADGEFSAKGRGIDSARVKLDATIAALDLTADVFDAAIASRPDVLEKLADEAVKEKQ